MLREMTLILVIVIAIFHSNEINCGVLDISHTGESSMVRRSVDSLDDSMKINSTLSWVPRVNGYGMETANPVGSNGTKRKPKFARLAFWTGLGLGSLANAAIDSTNPVLTPNPTASLRFSTSTQRPTSSDPLLNTLVRNLSTPESSDNNNFALLNQSLRSITQILERFTLRMNRQGDLLTERPDADNFQSLFETEESDNRLNDRYGSSRIRVYKKEKDGTSFVNLSELENLIRASIAQEFDNNRAKPSGMHGKKNKTKDEDETELGELNSITTTTSTTAPTTTILSDTTDGATTSATTTTTTATTTKPNFSGYFGGNSQNISGVDISSPWYGPPGYHRPPLNQIQYTMPAYSGPHYPPDHFQEPYEQYHHGPPDDSFSEQWFDYNSRGRNLSPVNKNKVLINGSGFVPSKLTRHA